VEQVQEQAEGALGLVAWEAPFPRRAHAIHYSCRLSESLLVWSEITGRCHFLALLLTDFLAAFF